MCPSIHGSVYVLRIHEGIGQRIPVEVKQISQWPNGPPTSSLGATYPISSPANDGLNSLRNSSSRKVSNGASKNAEMNSRIEDIIENNQIMDLMGWLKTS